MAVKWHSTGATYERGPIMAVKWHSTGATYERGPIIGVNGTVLELLIKGAQ